MEIRKPTIGRIVIYRTDGRNSLVYDLPAIVTCTKDSHPGDYPDGRKNPLPVPESDLHVHLTVFTPGGFGTRVDRVGSNEVVHLEHPVSEDFVGAEGFVSGSGTYVELDVAMASPEIEHRSWRWPEITS